MNELRQMTCAILNARWKIGQFLILIHESHPEHHRRIAVTLQDVGHSLCSEGFPRLPVVESLMDEAS